MKAEGREMEELTVCSVPVHKLDQRRLMTLLGNKIIVLRVGGGYVLLIGLRWPDSVRALSEREISPTAY